MGGNSNVSVMSGNYSCGGSSEEQLEFSNEFDFWCEGVVNAMLCVVSVLYIEQDCRS